MMLADGFGSNGSGSPGVRRLGQVVGGSLSRGLDVRLDASDASAEEVAVGSFVTIQGRRQRYFAVVTDIELRAVDDGVRHFPPAEIGGGGFMAEVISGTVAYGQLSVMPSMAVPIGPVQQGVAEQAKTIPEHFSPYTQRRRRTLTPCFELARGTSRWGRRRAWNRRWYGWTWPRWQTGGGFGDPPRAKPSGRELLWPGW